MLKRVAHMAERDGFVTFLSGAVENNNMDGITKWVMEKLLSKNPPISEDEKLAFFEAVKILSNSYICKGSIDYISKLFTAISNDEIENPKLKKIGCQILASSLIEKKDALTNNKVHSDELGGLLMQGCMRLEKSYQLQILEKVRGAFEAIQYDQGLKYVQDTALKAEYIRWLAEKMSNNDIESITKWITDNIVDNNSNTTTESKCDFYSAVASLLKGYIIDNKHNEVRALLNAIDGENFNESAGYREKLIRCQCEVIVSAIKESKESLEKNDSMRKILHDLLKDKPNFLNDEYNKSSNEDVKCTISTLLREVSEIVSFVGQNQAKQKFI